MEWLRVGMVAITFVALLWALYLSMVGGGCTACGGFGVVGRTGRLCPMCRGTGRELPAGPTWRMEIGKGGRLWWTCSNGTRVCGLCYDTGVVVDHIAGYKSGPCPECSRPDGKIRPMGATRA